MDISEFNTLWAPLDVENPHIQINKPLNLFEYIFKKLIISKNKNILSTLYLTESVSWSAILGQNTLKAKTE